MIRNNILYLLFIFLISHGTLSAEESLFPPKGSTVIEQLDLQNTLIQLIKQLDAEKWDDRKAAKESLLKLIKQSKPLFRFFVTTTLKSKNPEIKLSSREILFEYYKRYIYDPDKGNGFIGIQLAPGGVVNVKGNRYNTIRVVFPVVGFPGEKAGLKINDLILEIDKFRCSDNFGLNDFITYIATKSPGETVTLKLLSRGDVIKKEIVLAKRPESEMNSLGKKTLKELFEMWYNSIRME